VVATRENNSEPAILRSYKNSRGSELLYDECRVWEACRATSAATTFFDPIKIGKYGQRFIDGGLLYNNPINIAYREAETIWPGRDTLILSIGTGSAPGKPFRGNLMAIVERMKNIVTQTERTANDFYQSHNSLVTNDLLFRFNVAHNLSQIGLQEYKEMSAIADATQVYLGHGETRSKLSACISRLSSSIPEGNGSSNASTTPNRPQGLACLRHKPLVILES
jgi:patatin-like phospholipase/acyl hydrolase